MARLVALVSHLPESQMAIGTGFSQLIRGLGIASACTVDLVKLLMIFSVVGQVGGLAIASAVFQSRLNTELHTRLSGEPEEVRFDWQTFFYMKYLP